jgi:hypothetical protein
LLISESPSVFLTLDSCTILPLISVSFLRRIVHAAAHVSVRPRFQKGMHRKTYSGTSRL